MVGMLVLSLVLSSVNSYISARISIYVNNDIQAGIFEKIMDARWRELSTYPSGDLLNRVSELRWMQGIDHVNIKLIGGRYS